MRLGEKIERDILGILKEYTSPVSTRELCLKTSRAWHSVNTHCLKLQMAGKLKGYKIGNINAWSLK